MGRRRASRKQHDWNLPDRFTALDNRLLDSAEYAALCKRNSRAAVLLTLLHRFMWRGSQEDCRADGKLAQNGALGLPRKVVKRFMCKTAQGRAIKDLIAVGAVKVTQPARRPEKTARLLLIENPEEWKPIPAAKERQKRARGPNGIFLPKNTNETRSPEREDEP